MPAGLGPEAGPIALPGAVDVRGAQMQPVVAPVAMHGQLQTVEASRIDAGTVGRQRQGQLQKTAVVGQAHGPCQVAGPPPGDRRRA